MSSTEYRTAGGLSVRRTIAPVPLAEGVTGLVDALDRQRGAVFASLVEAPGRYSRWDVGFVDPPLVATVRGRTVELEAPDGRGLALLEVAARALVACDAVEALDGDAAVGALRATVRHGAGEFTEEERLRRPSVLSVLRALTDAFASPDDHHLGLYGAFGYDLIFALEPIELRHARPVSQRDAVLYVPDRLVVVDHQRRVATEVAYAFSCPGAPSTAVRAAPAAPRHDRVAPPASPERYCAVVEEARERFRRGELFEVVPSQVLAEPTTTPPSEVFRRLSARNPSPYGFLVNLGEGEHLVGASPEMFVRVSGREVETCPISGTIARGDDALEDAEQVRRLLNSVKDEAELTMCTDVDRNDKSRVCEPGTVEVVGRRQIELYSRLIHTVDHVKGRLAEGVDAWDAFASHLWAVTVTGAPKRAAIQFVEDHEDSPRGWYAGAVGFATFDGDMNTGLTLRTVRLAAGAAEVRVGATLLFDSVPEEEEAETRLKAAAMLDAVLHPAPRLRVREARRFDGPAPKVLLVDHEDSFVHTLAGELRRAGAAVETRRAGFAESVLDDPDLALVVLSPGPGRPADYDVAGTVGRCVERGLPVFGVCLGLQGVVEHFGGALDQLGEPRHGKASPVTVVAPDSPLFADLPAAFPAGRYHSLHARRDGFPAELRVTAEADDGVVMAVEHRTLPIAAVQFHPESILTAAQDVGRRLLDNVVATLALARPRAPVA